MTELKSEMIVEERWIRRRLADEVSEKVDSRSEVLPISTKQLAGKFWNFLISACCYLARL